MFNIHQSIGVYGFGVEGKSLYSWLTKHGGNHVFIFDEKNTLPKFGENEKKILDIIFGKKKEVFFLDSNSQKIFLQKGNRRYGFNHLKKHLKPTVSGMLSYLEILIIPEVLQLGNCNAKRQKKYPDGTLSELYEKEINGVLFQVVTREKDGKKYIVSFFSSRKFTHFLEKSSQENTTKKIGEGPLDQPNSYLCTSIIPDKNLSEQDIFSLPLQALKYMQKIFRSPGVHPSKILKWIGAENIQKISSATELFFQLCPTKNTIGVTGTKGKGTTCSLIYEMLSAEFSGKKQVFLGGNIGTPVFDFFDTISKDDIVIVELSSFQLYDVSSSPHIAVLLRTDTEHLDWHSDTLDYRKAKENIFAFQKKNDVCVYFGESKIIKTMLSHHTTKAEKISVFSQDEKKNIVPEISGKISGSITPEFSAENPEISTADIQLRGAFHQENVFPAIAVAKQFGVSNSTLKEVIQKFSGLPMRCELIATKNGIQFFNDSFSTIPETTLSAITILKSPLFLILGGSEKHSDFSLLAQKITEAKHIKKIYLIGITADRLAKELVKNQYSHFEKMENLSEIFADFKKISKKGDSLLLSPACASFGMFANYKERGKVFNELVSAF